MFLKAFSRVGNCFFFVLPVLLLSGCDLLPSVRQKEDIVASVGDAYLTAQDLSGVIPSGMMPLDSMELADKKISAWISHQVLLQKAQQNLDKSIEKEISEKLAAYRESLLIFYYENHVTRHLLDTVVSMTEIEDYYRENQSQFVLKSNIVRARFVKMPAHSKALKKMRELLFSQDSEEANLYELAMFCRENADNYFLDGERWLFFTDLLREVPIRTYNQEEFLRNYRNVEVESGDFIYLVQILDFKVRDMVSPISFEQGRIRTIILNQRKKQILSQMQADLLREAEASGSVKVYKKP